MGARKKPVKEWVTNRRRSVGVRNGKRRNVPRRSQNKITKPVTKLEKKKTLQKLMGCPPPTAAVMAP